MPRPGLVKLPLRPPLPRRNCLFGPSQDTRLMYCRARARFLLALSRWLFVYLRSVVIRAAPFLPSSSCPSSLLSSPYCSFGIPPNHTAHQTHTPWLQRPPTPLPTSTTSGRSTSPRVLCSRYVTASRPSISAHTFLSTACQGFQHQP
jgi:hypothetical protein